MKYKEKQLDYALKGIMEELVAWGLCNSEKIRELGFRRPEVLHLSVDGATLIFDLINELSKEIMRLERLEWNEGGNDEQIPITSKTKR